MLSYIVKCKELSRTYVAVQTSRCSVMREQHMAAAVPQKRTHFTLRDLAGFMLVPYNTFRSMLCHRAIILMAACPATSPPAVWAILAEASQAAAGSRSTMQTAIRSSRAVYGITSPHVVAALNPEQRSAGSSFCSMRGFASMPDAALQRDSQHYTGRVTQSGRGFASSSEPAQQSAAPAAESAQQPFIPPGRIHNAPAPPWTPTRDLRKRNFLPRRMGHLMEVSHTACLA